MSILENKINFTDFQGTPITDEVINRADTASFALEHDTFFEESFEIWTAQGQSGTKLTKGTDYELSNLNQQLTNAAGKNIYTRLAITNLDYLNQDIYVNYTTLGDFTTFDDLELLEAEIENNSNSIKSNEEIQDLVSASLQGSGATTISYDDANDTLTISSTDTDTQRTDSEIQTAINNDGDHDATATHNAKNINVSDTNVNITTSEMQDAIEKILNNYVAGGDIDLNGYSIQNVESIEQTETYGIEWNQTRDSYTRLADSKGLSVPGAQTAGYKYSDFDDIFPWSEMGRVNLADSGTVNARYGDPTYATDGSNGQVMVEIPKFYSKFELVDTTGDRIFRWYVSKENLDGFSVDPMFVRDGAEKDYIYIAAFEGNVNNDVMRSIAGVQPSTDSNVADGTLPGFRTYAQNRGTGWNIRDYYTTHAVQMLYLIEYGHFNTQEQLGRGIVDKDSGSGNESKNTGATSGNQSYGDPDNGYTAISYRGIENFYGNIWEFTDGININDSEVYVASENFVSDKFTDNYNLLGTVLSSSDTYITDIIEGSFLANAGGGTSTTFLADNWWINSGQRVARFGGAWHHGSRAGGFCWGLNSSSSGALRDGGSRLLYF